MHRRTFALSLFTALAGVPALGWTQTGGGMGGMGGMGGGGMGGPPGGGRPGGRRGGPGNGPGGRPGAPSPDLRAPVALRVNYTGLVALSGQQGALSDKTVATVKADQSAFLLTRGAELKLERVAISAAIPLTAFSEVSLDGLGAAIVALEGAVTEIIDGQVETRQTGLPGIYASGPGTRTILRTTKVRTFSAYAPAVVLTNGAALEAAGLVVTTQSDHAPAIDIRGGEARLEGTSLTTSGPASPAIGLSGRLTGKTLKLAADREPAVEVRGPGQVQLEGCDLSGGHVAIVFGEGAVQAGPAGGPPPGFNAGPQPAPDRNMGPVTGSRPAAVGAAPDAASNGPPQEARFDMTGGSLMGRVGVFQVYNCRTVITLDGVTVGPEAGLILKSSARKLGDSGGRAVLNVRRQKLNGRFETDIISSIQLSLAEGSAFSGTATSNVNVAIDATSRWRLTGDSSVGRLDLGDGPVEDALARIDSGGHVLNYSKRANPRLNGQTFALPGGGTLQPDMGL